MNMMMSSTTEALATSPTDFMIVVSSRRKSSHERASLNTRMRRKVRSADRPDDVSTPASSTPISTSEMVTMMPSKMLKNEAM